MLLYDSPMPAPNTRRVRMFLHERGIDLPVESVSIEHAEHKTAEFRKVSPYAQLPALRLDDGTALTESVAICRYLETRYPGPTLFGDDPLESARVEMWIRRVDLRLGRAVSMTWLHTHPFNARHVVPQFKDFGAAQRQLAENLLANEIDVALAETPWLAGSRFSMADIVLLCVLEFGIHVGITLSPELQALKGWHARMQQRESHGA